MPKKKDIFNGEIIIPIKNGKVLFDDISSDMGLSPEQISGLIACAQAYFDVIRASKEVLNKTTG